MPGGGAQEDMVSRDLPAPAMAPFHPHSLSERAMGIGSAWVQAVLCPHSPTHVSSAQKCFPGPGSAQHCAYLPAPVQGAGPHPIPRDPCIPQSHSRGCWLAVPEPALPGTGQPRLWPGREAAQGVPQPHDNWRRFLLFNIPGIFCQG